MATASWANFPYHEYGGPDEGGFGMKDIEEMQRRGYSNAQIRILANTAVSKGRTPVVYKGAQNWVGANTTKPPWMYGKYGQEHFGISDVRAAKDQGLGLDKIREFADFATLHGIGVGQEAKNWMKMEEELETKNQELGTTTKALEESNQALLAIAQKEIPVQEPPKPTYGGNPVAQIVPGTTRFQGRTPTAKKGSRSGTLKRRFGREYFSSPLAIGGGAGGGGAASSKVLNV